MPMSTTMEVEMEPAITKLMIDCMPSGSESCTAPARIANIYTAEMSLRWGCKTWLRRAKDRYIETVLFGIISDLLLFELLSLIFRL